MVRDLKDNEVFVFGTNGSGFHGAGAAGYAMLHVEGNKWRNTFVPGTNKLISEVPDHTKGYWAVKGISTGLMHGLYGKSYGIQTVTKPGSKRSIPLLSIRTQLVSLKDHISDHDYNYIVAPLAIGYGGYSRDEMAEIINSIHWPQNRIRFIQLEQ
jgi:hypothetical protein